MGGMRMAATGKWERVLAAGMLAAAGALGCGLLAGCGGAAGALLPAANTKPVPGVPAGPLLGYIWSSSDQTLRPMLGVLGSSMVGQTIVPAGMYVAGAASSASEMGLVEDDAGNLFSLSLPLPAATRVATGVVASAKIVFSPSGGGAVAYAAGGTSVTVIADLATTPRATTVALPAGMKLGSAILSDEGTMLVEAQGSPMAVGVLSAAGVFTRVTTVAQAGGMSFLAGGDDALVADGAKSSVSLLKSVAGAGGVQALSALGVNQPLAVASSQDGRWAVVANAGDKNVVWIDLKNGGVNALAACACQPTQLSLLAGGQAFRLNGLESGPVWMANLSGASPQLVFAPAVH